jgi:Transglutaminase-like superfamily
MCRTRFTCGQLSVSCFVAGPAFLVGGVACFQHAHSLSSWQCTVINTASAPGIEGRGTGPKQDLESIGLLKFRAHIAPLLKAEQNTVDTIAALRHWARSQQSSEPALWRFSPEKDSGDVDPGILLEQQHSLTPGACRRFGYILAGALVSAGIPARLVSLQATFSDGLGHIMVEAWVDELGKWILVDPTNDTMFLVDGHYASLLELRKALLSGELQRISFERNGSSLEPTPKLQYFSEISRHAFVFRNECYFTDPPLGKGSLWRLQILHYVDEYAPPYPESTKKALLASAATLTACSVILFCAGIALATPLRWVIFRRPT